MGFGLAPVGPLSPVSPHLTPLLPPPGQADVCSFPARCVWQPGLQESVLRHHTRGGEGLEDAPHLESARLGGWGQGSRAGMCREASPSPQGPGLKWE